MVMGRLLTGQPASLGVAAGPVLCVESAFDVFASSREVGRRGVPAAPSHECSRVREAAKAVADELTRARAAIETVGVDAAALGWTEGAMLEFLGAQRLMAEDPELLCQMEQAVQNGSFTAEESVSEVFGAVLRTMVRSESPTLQGRVADLRDVANALLRHLRGDPPLPQLVEPRIVVAQTLAPGELLRLGRDKILAVVLEQGHVTDHVATLLRTGSVPCVVDVPEAVRKLRSGSTVLVDGGSGTVQLAPALEDVRAARAEAVACWPTASGGEPAHLKSVKLSASIALPEEAAKAIAAGAQGVGLFRTEFLCLLAGGAVSEGRQRDAYQEALRHASGRTVTFRTYDFGGEKADPKTETGASGSRGLARALLERRELSTQLRALCTLAPEDGLEVLFPFVESVEAFAAARGCVDALVGEGNGVVRPPLGAMIESKAGAAVCRDLMRMSDFAAVGTNDLSRAYAPTGHEPDFLDPELHHVLAEIGRTAVEEETPLRVCGAMTADPIALVVLRGMGFDRFSVPCGMLPRVRATLARIAPDDAADAVEACRAGGARTTVLERFGPALTGLWPTPPMRPPP